MVLLYTGVEHPMPELTEQQNAALDWLFDASEDRRRTGRSAIMAIALIRAALRSPGREVYIVDHVGHRFSTEATTRLIESMLAPDRLIHHSYRLNSARRSLLIRDLPRGVNPNSWLPENWTLPVFRNAPVRGLMPLSIPEPTVPEDTLWDYLQDPTF
jgi:hypothetical protein